MFEDTGGDERNPTATGTPTGTATKTATGTETATRTQSETQTQEEPEGPGELAVAPKNVGTYKPMRKEVAAFEDLGFWDTHRGVKLTAEKKNPYQGSQSGRVKNTSGTIVHEFPIPKDLSNKDISLVFDVKQPKTTNVRIWFQDTRGRQTKLIQVLYDGHPDTYIRINPSINSANADMSKIVQMLITIDGGEKPIEYLIDDIQFHDRPANKPKVMLTFDDATEDTYQIAYPIMKKHGLKGTVAVPNEVIGERNRMSQSELERIYNDGWEIASHSLDFQILPPLPPEEQKEKIRLNKKYLEQRGFGPIRAFMYPGGVCDKHTVKYVSEYHDLGFLAFLGAEKGNSQSALMSPYFVNRANMSSFHAVRNQVDAVNAYGGGLVTPYWHTIGGENGEISVEHFRDLCRYLEVNEKRNNLDVVVPSDLLPEKTTRSTT